jgi:hypothetical protein
MDDGLALQKTLPVVSIIQQYSASGSGTAVSCIDNIDMRN